MATIELPVCRWGADSLNEHGRRACHSRNVLSPPAGMDPAFCVGTCPYRDRPDDNPHQTPPRACVHLGRRSRQADGSVKQVLCDSGCAKGTMLDVFQCRLHCEIILSDCARCPDRATREKASDFPAEATPTGVAAPTDKEHALLTLSTVARRNSATQPGSLLP